MDRAFREGGPYRTRRMPGDNYQMSVSVPLDADGMRGSECPDEECAPRYFKVRPGTGITEGQEVLWCPYCRREGHPEDFITRAQWRYAIRIAEREVLRGVHRMLGSALGLDARGSRTIGGGFLTVKLSLPRPRLMSPSAPREEELRREMRCPVCTLEHAVFGFAVWCPDCGFDIFLCHLAAEWEAVRSALAAVDRRREEHGSRVAANDVENALEDMVSIFEAALKVTVRRFLLAKGLPEGEVVEILDRKVRNGFQSITRAEELLRNIAGVELLLGEDAAEVARVKLVFEKRHAITHNRGVVDEKFITRTGLGARGREVAPSAAEVEQAIAFARRVVERVYSGLFPEAVKVTLGA